MTRTRTSFNGGVGHVRPLDIHTMSRPACIVMVKAPRPGSVKTRLVPPLCETEAATLAACFARDTVRNVQSTVDDVIVAYTPHDGRSALETLLRNDHLRWLEQCGDDLGERLDAVMKYAASIGHSPIVVVGTDSPTVPASFIQDAISSLSGGESDIALGPTEDGGYYLVGVRGYVKNLFHNVALSTPLAFAQTRLSAAALNLRILELPRWFDIDTASDLHRLRNDIFRSEEARSQAPATYEWLRAYSPHLFSNAAEKLAP